MPSRWIVSFGCAIRFPLAHLLANKGVGAYVVGIIFNARSCAECVSCVDVGKTVTPSAIARSIGTRLAHFLVSSEFRLTILLGKTKVSTFKVLRTLAVFGTLLGTILLTAAIGDTGTVDAILCLLTLFPNFLVARFGYAGLLLGITFPATWARSLVVTGLGTDLVDAANLGEHTQFAFAFSITKAIAQRAQTTTLCLDTEVPVQMLQVLTLEIERACVVGRVTTFGTVERLGTTGGADASCRFTVKKEPLFAVFSHFLLPLLDA